MEKTRQKGFAAWFIDNWKRKPLFCTGIALLVMVVLQILALGFDYASFGEWFGAFSRNWINILRNNAGVGIVALGMTFVIISGGIEYHIAQRRDRCPLREIDIAGIDLVSEFAFLGHNDKIYMANIIFFCLNINSAPPSPHVRE